MARKRTKGSTLRKLGSATDVSLGDFSTRAMREYGSFVLMDRAVSDVRDGLKPVQRRILWAMHQLKATSDKSFKKSAKVVGDCMGGYHPHGGEAIYGTLVTMVGARYPLIEGQGNFGGPTDSPASMRYCVVGSTLVDTELGLVPIEDIVNGSVAPRLALSLGGEYSPIVRAIDSGVQDTLTVTTRLGCQITVTPNEPLLVLQGGSLTPGWVLAEDLKVGSTVCLARDSLSHRIQVNPVPDGFRNTVLGLIGDRVVSPRAYLTDDGTTVTLSKEDIDRFTKCLYSSRDRIEEILSLISSISVGLRDKIKGLLSLPYIFDAVSSIEPSGSQQVFDLTVESTHAYVGNGFLVHNTEARLTKLAELLLEDISVGEFVPNYSGDLQEPLVLPSRLPLLFLNGSSGIGVGVRAVIPPHNMKELVRVLAYVLRKKNPRLSTALKYLNGPDYGYGVLLSSREDIESLYATGKGTLRYRCEYEYLTDNKENVLLVKGLAPGFNMSSFLTKMKGLHEAGLLSYCSDASSADGVRIHVGFTDPQVIKERVLPELHTSQSYQFYTVKRTDDSSLNEETLFSGGLFQLLSEFLDFRRKVERLRLTRELRVEKAKLHKVNAVLAALSKLDKVYDVLKMSHRTLDDMRAAMATALSITDKQAGLILEMKVYRLARMNAESQKKLKVDIRATIAEIKSYLGDIDSVILSSLKEIVKFSDPRGTRVLDQDDAPVIPVSTSKKYLLVQGVKAVRIDKDPSRRHKFDLIATDPSSVLLVYRDNSVTRVGLSYFSEDTLPSVPVGVVPGGSFALCAIDSRGLLAQVAIPSKSPFNVMRGATTLLSAVGVNEGDTLVVVYPSGMCKTLPPSSLERKRAFSLGKKPFPRSIKEVPVSLLVANSTTRIYSGNGRCVAPRSGDAYMSKSISFETQGELFSISERNFVLLANDGKRDIVDRKAAISLLKSSNLGKCWPLQK